MEESILTDPRGNSAVVEVLKDILGMERLQLVECQLVDENPHRSRRAERYGIVDLSTGVRHSVFVKSGFDDGLYREINLYAGLFVPEVDPVPRLLGYRAASTHQYLVLEWLDGRPPLFTNEADVRLVFHELGIWSEDLAERIHRFDSGDRSVFRTSNKCEVGAFVKKLLKDDTIERDITRTLSEVAAMVETNRQLLVDVGGNRLVGHLSRLTPLVIHWLVRAIMGMPTTLDTGDISLHNVFLCSQRPSAVFFDFEFAGVRPISLGLELLGDRFDSVPQGSLVDAAIDSYLDGWNRAGRRAISELAFRRSHACARFHYACRTFLGCIRRATVQQDEQGFEYAKEEAAVVQQAFEGLPL